MKHKKEYLILIAILLSGVLIRILLFKSTEFIPPDVLAYARLGKNLIESGKYVFGENFNFGIFMPPLYPIFIGIVNLFVNDLLFSTKLISIIASVITTLLFYMIGKELYNKEAGLFAASAFAIHPLMIKISLQGNSESLFYCFLFLSIYLFILLSRKNNIFIYTLLGISSALSFLTRSEGLLLLLLPLLHLLRGNPFKNKDLLLKTSFVFLIFILIASPRILFLKNSTGKFTLTGQIDHLAVVAEMGGDKNYHELRVAPGNPYDKVGHSLNEEKTQVKGFEIDTESSFFDYIFKDPLKFLGRYLKNVLREIKAMIKLLTPIILPLFFAFFNSNLFKKKERLIFILFPFLYFCIYPLFVIIERHTFLIVLFLILFSSFGFENSKPALSNLLDFYGVKKNRVAAFLEKNIKYIIIIVFILSSFSYYKFTSYGKTPTPAEHVKLGHYIKNNISSEYEKLNIMSGALFVSFYSDARFTMLPYANSSDVIHFAKLYNVDYIAVDERRTREWEFYDELINLDKYSDEVELVYEDSSGKIIKLFKVKN